MGFFFAEGCLLISTLARFLAGCIARRAASGLARCKAQNTAQLTEHLHTPIMLLCTLLVVLGAHAHTGHGGRGTGAIGASMLVNVGAAPLKGRPVPPNMVGFSLESYSVRKTFYPAYAKLLTHLRGASPDSTGAGPVLRIGGDSADESCWSPRPVGSSPDEAHCRLNLTMEVHIYIFIH